MSHSVHYLKQSFDSPFYSILYGKFILSTANGKETPTDLVGEEIGRNEPGWRWDNLRNDQLFDLIKTRMKHMPVPKFDHFLKVGIDKVDSEIKIPTSSVSIAADNQLVLL